MKTGTRLPWSAPRGVGGRVEVRGGVGGVSMEKTPIKRSLYLEEGRSGVHCQYPHFFLKAKNEKVGPVKKYN